MKQQFRWIGPHGSPEEGGELAEALGVPPLVGRLLASRGFTNPETARAFLWPGPESLHDPFTLKGMTQAVERIRRAIAEGELIRVYGDYDADGVTSTALMSRLLERFGARFDTYIPHRSREGYGLNIPAIDRAAEAGVSLIVTVDNGISAVEQIAHANSLGLDVVVTDHHEPPAILPEAYAIVNPKQPDCEYPFKELSGSAVAYKLAHAILGEPDTSLSDVAAIGIIADLMPLVGENRTIVKMGLAEMNREPTPGVRALAALSGAEPGRLTSGRIAFGLAPRLNASGRLAEADGALRLLMATTGEEAESLALSLDALNRERQKLVDDTLIEAEAAWQARIAANHDEAPSVIVVAGEGWNAGIAGLVASKLVERYYKPTLVLAYDRETGLCKGSARSIDGFDLHGALTECADEMEHFGGHKAAAGMTMKRERVEALEQRLSQIASDWLTPEDWIPKKKVDLVCRASELTLEAAEQLTALEPYGSSNPTPRLLVKDAAVTDARSMGKEGKHLRAVLEQGGRRLESVGFGMGGKEAAMRDSGYIDVLGELAINEWNGSKRVQIMLQDWRSARLPVLDRRGEPDFQAAIRALAEQSGSGELLAVTAAGASLDGLDVQENRLIKSTYTEASLIASGKAGLRLALVGLPAQGSELEGLKQLLRLNEAVSEVYLFSGDEAEARIESPSAMPSREQFGEVYSLFKRQGSWIDAPDGFLRQISDRTGWPLAAVRMMQDVFEELGFIKRSRSSLEVVAGPPKRKLDQSERYLKAKHRAEVHELASMSWPSLQGWLREQVKAEG